MVGIYHDCFNVLYAVSIKEFRSFFHLMPRRNINQAVMQLEFGRTDGHEKSHREECYRVLYTPQKNCKEL